MAAPAPIVTRMIRTVGFFVAPTPSVTKFVVLSKLHWQSASAPRSVVMAGTGDPVATGLVESVVRPGGNVPGQSSGVVSGRRQESATSTADPNALGSEKRTPIPDFTSAFGANRTWTDRRS